MRPVLAALLVAGACTSNGESSGPSPARLVREGATPTLVRSGQLDGRGSAELVVASASEEAGGFGLPTPYLEVFAERGATWRRVFDGSGTVPEGAPPGAPAVLEVADPSVASGQAVEVLEVVDFAGDGASEIVLAVTNAGAGGGPLSLWVLGMGDGRIEAEYFVGTERGGRVEIAGRTVELEFGVYRRRDPGCCPSLIERRTIGWDGAAGRIANLARERRKASG